MNKLDQSILKAKQTLDKLPVPIADRTIYFKGKWYRTDSKGELIKE